MGQKTPFESSQLIPNWVTFNMLEGKAAAYSDLNRLEKLLAKGS